MKKSNDSTPTGKSPPASTEAPKAPLSANALRAQRIGEAIVNRLNFNVLAEHRGRAAAQAFLRETYPHMTDEEIVKATAHIPINPSNVVPFPDEGERYRQRMLAEIRKIYPHLSDQEIIDASNGLL